MRYRFEFEQGGDPGSYDAWVQLPERRRPRRLEGLRLGPDEPVALPGGEPIPLAQVVQRLVAFDPEFLSRRFNERGQMELGRLLYRQTVGQLEEIGERPPAVGEEVELRLAVGEDEHLLRLPWVLLSARGTFLCTAGWSVALAGPAAAEDRAGAIELPPSPRILIAAPEPRGLTRTRGGEHVDELERSLLSGDPYLERGQRLTVVRRWDELKNALEAAPPDIFYYYGHGRGNLDSSRLVFEAKAAEGMAGKPEERPVADLAQLLRSASRRPLLAYLNCCQGDSGGLLGAGGQLAGFVPAVLSNRTIAYVAAARLQAMAFFRAVVLEGAAPARAAAQLYSRIGDLELSFRDTRWLTPVLHASYQSWRANPPRPLADEIADPIWHLKLDRVDQYGRVSYETREMIRYGRPVSWSYLWYGKEGQGVDLFCQRLKEELSGELASSCYLVERRPEWPDELAEPELSFRHMLLEALEISRLDELPGRLRGETRGESGRRILFYLRHAPMRSGGVVRLDDVLTYLRWLDREVSPVLGAAGMHALIGLSFIAANPPKLAQQLRTRLDRLELRRTQHHLLDELEALAKQDLVAFFRTHKVELPTEDRELLIGDVLAQTGGVYEHTLQALRERVARAWTLRQEGGGEAAADGAEEEPW